MSLTVGLLTRPLVRLRRPLASLTVGLLLLISQTLTRQLVRLRRLLASLTVGLLTRPLVRLRRPLANLTVGLLTRLLVHLRLQRLLVSLTLSLCFGLLLLQSV